MEARHVEVRIRNASDAEESPHLFTTWPVDDLDNLVTAMNQWSNPGGFDVSGQFSHYGERWFFELVVHDDD